VANKLFDDKYNCNVKTFFIFFSILHDSAFFFFVCKTEVIFFSFTKILMKTAKFTQITKPHFNQIYQMQKYSALHQSMS